MAQYRVGRVTVTHDSDVVNGFDTQFNSNVQPGDIFLVRGDDVPYRVASVTNDLTLRLSARYASPTESNTFYSITRDFTENYNLPIIHNGDVDAVPIFAEALIQLDAKLQVGGGGGATTLGGLSDVSVVAADPGDYLTMLPNGSFGFVPPTEVSISFTHAEGDGGRIFRGYTGGVLTARRIKVSGGTIVENPDDLTINIPQGGEANTLATAGSAESQSLVSPKFGTILRTKGLRAGPNVTLTPEGQDIVIAATGGSGGGGTTYTMGTAGTGASLVAPMSGSEFRVKTLTFDTNFTSSDHVGGGLAVGLKTLPITQISTVLWDSIAPGQVLSRNNAGQIVGTTLQSFGLTAIVQDLTPKLGGDLDMSGKDIIGMPVSFSGVIERPKGKPYTICLSAPVAMRLNSITVSTMTGTLDVRVDINFTPESTPEETPPSPIQGTASPVRQTFSASQIMLCDPTQTIILNISSVSADIEDFLFTLSGTTV